jgi:hypothetical protein
MCTINFLVLEDLPEFLNDPEQAGVAPFPEPRF